MEKKEVIEKRKQLQKLAKKSYVFKKGDKRTGTPRICVVCGRPLTSLIIRENTYITTVPHVRFYVSDMFTLDCCLDINSCYRIIRQKGELDEDVNGR